MSREGSRSLCPSPSPQSSQSPQEASHASSASLLPPTRGQRTDIPQDSNSSKSCRAASCRAQLPRLPLLLSTALLMSRFPSLLAAALFWHRGSEAEDVTVSAAAGCRTPPVASPLLLSWFPPPLLVAPPWCGQGTRKPLFCKSVKSWSASSSSCSFSFFSGTPGSSCTFPEKGFQVPGRSRYRGAFASTIVCAVDRTTVLTHDGVGNPLLALRPRLLQTLQGTSLLCSLPATVRAGQHGTDSQGAGTLLFLGLPGAPISSPVTCTGCFPANSLLMLVRWCSGARPWQSLRSSWIRSPLV